MKILCRYDASGPHYVRSGWGKAFKAAGYDFRFWVPQTKSAFDAFAEFEPNIFLGTTYDTDRALVKCIAARPELKVGLFASAWGPRIDEIDVVKYPIVVVNEQEKRTIAHLKETTGRPDFVFIHVTDKYLEPTMSDWRSIGVEPVGILNAADIIDYHPAEPIDALKCDIGFCGGYWGYKGRNLNSHILPLCHPSSGLNVKIFGNKTWPTHAYLGTLADASVKHLFNSATVCPNVSEPHSTDVDGLTCDIVERPFKVLSSGGFCVSDYVEEAREVFGVDELVMCKSASEFHETIYHFVENPELRLPFIEAGQIKTLKSETYFDRTAKMATHFAMPELRNGLLEAKRKIIGHLFERKLVDVVYPQISHGEHKHDDEAAQSRQVTPGRNVHREEAESI